MIHLTFVQVGGTSTAGAFEGQFSFTPGLQVISARNNFGKSLSASAVGWCLGLEPMFGLQWADTARLPLAVREGLDLPSSSGVSAATVESSYALLGICRHDNARLTIRRAIVGGDRTRVTVTEIAPDGTVQRESDLSVTQRTMKDETGGFQHFLFKWAGLPQVPVMKRTGDEGEIYLENIAPLFFIDQAEGWNDIQSMQVHRYGLIDITSVAIEYLLGAQPRLAHRFQQERETIRVARLKDRAVVASASIESLFEQQGWAIKWSAWGDIEQIAARWSHRSLLQTIREETETDLAQRLSALHSKRRSLERIVEKGETDPVDTSASGQASQQLIELKTKRHELRDELRTLRLQRAEECEIAESLFHRIHGATDVLRLKREGIGRIVSHVECPTCRRTIDPSTFDLNQQTADSIQAHIGALQRDRALIRSNLDSIESRMIELEPELSTTDTNLTQAERALRSINEAVGATREQLIKASHELSATLGEIGRIDATLIEIARHQTLINEWVQEASGGTSVASADADLLPRKTAFENRVAEFLDKLQHEGIADAPGLRLTVHEDEGYTPYWGRRRVRSLGSASDRSRLIQAYILALAHAAAVDLAGNEPAFHPGFVLLDEPLQQNQDKKHRRRFVDYLVNQGSDQPPYQVIIFTYLFDEEIGRLRESGITLHTPETPERPHFLELVKPPEPSVASDEDDAGADEPPPSIS